MKRTILKSVILRSEEVLQKVKGICVRVDKKDSEMKAMAKELSIMSKSIDKNLKILKGYL